MSAIKKAVKKVGKFVKKHWRKIALVAAVVFTAGIASVGAAGFSSAVGAKGVLAAIGGTLKAGVAAIGGTLGIGSGVTPATAGGMFSAGGSGAVGAMGSLSSGMAAGLAPSAAIQAGAYAGGATIPTLGAVTAVGAAPAAAGLSSFATSAAAAGAAGSLAAKPSVSKVDIPSQERFAQQAPGLSAPPTAPPQSMLGRVGSGVSSFLKQDGVASALVSGGLNAIGSYMAASAQEEDEAINAMYGVSPREGDTSLTPAQMRFTTPVESRNSWRPRLMYDA